MTQHVPSQTDQQHAARPPVHETGGLLDQENRPGPSGWWIGLLALLPIACCGLPLLIAAGVTAGSGAALGGITGGVLMLAGAAALGIWGMRRHARATRPRRQPDGHTPDTRQVLLSTDPGMRPHSPSTEEQKP